MNLDQQIRAALDQHSAALYEACEPSLSPWPDDPDGSTLRFASTIRAVLDLHPERRIYDACGHDHPLNPDHTLPAGLVCVDEVGVVCQDGYEYSACRYCCCDADGNVTEECATEHEGGCWPCAHHRAIADALGLLYPIAFSSGLNTKEAAS